MKSEEEAVGEAQFPESPIRRTRVHEEVVSRVLSMIQAGQLPPGSKLPSERELMAKFQVGRSAIREALNSLEQMGLISVNHGARARVRSPSAQEIFDQIGPAARMFLRSEERIPRELREMRSMFEVVLVRRAAELANDENIGQLKAALDANEAAISDRQTFVKTDIAFHVEIARISGNSILTNVSEAVLQWLAEYHADIVRFEGAEAIAHAEHRRIFGCIAAKDPDGAEAAMRDHLDRVNIAF